MRRIVRLLCIVLTLTLVSCSSVQLAYNNAPSLMQYQLDRYLDLTDEQEKQLRAQLITLQRWHQSAALPIYAATLRKWAHSLSQPGAFSVDDIQAKQKAVQNVVLIFAYEGARVLGPVLITLTPRQREYLAARFEES